MNSIIKKICVFRKDEKGVTMIEYALLATLVSIAAITALTTLGTDIAAKFTHIATTIGS